MGGTMANGRNPKKGNTGRDGGGFMAIPWIVMDCPAYQALSHPAKALLFEIARQFVRDNNGRLLASRAYLLKRGWNSSDVITRAKAELIAAGFVHETVKGHRPNKAGWYALTWQALDRIPGYDVGAAETFERGAYRKNAPLRPYGGTGGTSIAPPHGTERPRTVPPHGAIRPVFSPPPVPSDGHHLEKPSIGSSDPAPTDHAELLVCEFPSGKNTEHEVIATPAELWQRVGHRSLWRTVPPPDPRLMAARAAQRTALTKTCHRAAPADDGGITRDRCGDGCHDTSAWEGL